MAQIQTPPLENDVTPAALPDDETGGPTEFTAADQRLMNVIVATFALLTVLLVVIEYFRTH